MEFSSFDRQVLEMKPSYLGPYKIRVTRRKRGIEIFSEFSDRHLEEDTRGFHCFRKSFQKLFISPSPLTLLIPGILTILQNSFHYSALAWIRAEKLCLNFTIDRASSWSTSPHPLYSRPLYSPWPVTLILYSHIIFCLR